MRVTQRVGIGFMVSVALASPTFAHAYSYDTHWYLTYLLARDAGFTRVQAERIAVADQLCDEHPKLEPLQLASQFSTIPTEMDKKHGPRVRIHAMMNESGGYRVWSNVAIKEIEDQFAKLGRSCQRFDNLGPAVHFLQDTYSHWGYGSYIGHWNAADLFRKNGLSVGGLTDALGFEPKRWSPDSASVFPDLGRDLKMISRAFEFLKSQNPVAPQAQSPLRAMAFYEARKEAFLAEVAKRVGESLVLVELEQAFSEIVDVVVGAKDDSQTIVEFERICRQHGEPDPPRRTPLSAGTAVDRYPISARFGTGDDLDTKPIDDPIHGLNLTCSLTISQPASMSQQLSVKVYSLDEGAVISRRLVGSVNPGPGQKAVLKAVPVGSIEIEVSGTISAVMRTSVSRCEEQIVIGRSILLDDQSITSISLHAAIPEIVSYRSWPPVAALGVKAVKFVKDGGFDKAIERAILDSINKSTSVPDIEAKAIELRRDYEAMVATKVSLDVGGEASKLQVKTSGAPRDPGRGANWDYPSNASAWTTMISAKLEEPLPPFFVGRLVGTLPPKSGDISVRLPSGSLTIGRQAVSELRIFLTVSPSEQYKENQEYPSASASFVLDIIDREIFSSFKPESWWAKVKMRSIRFRDAQAVRTEGVSFNASLQHYGGELYSLHIFYEYSDVNTKSKTKSADNAEETVFWRHLQTRKLATTIIGSTPIATKQTDRWPVSHRFMLRRSSYGSWKSFSQQVSEGAYDIKMTVEAK